MLTFIHIPKTAGSTINLVLRSSFGVRHCDVRKVYRENNCFMENDLTKNQSCWPFGLKSIASHDITLDSKLNNPIFFTFLRDPLKRCVSHYQFYIEMTQSDITYEEWLENPKMQNLQTSYFSSKKDATEAIKNMEENSVTVGITENVNESLILLNSRLKEANIQLPKKSKNISKNNDLKNSILGDPKLRDLTIQANTHDTKIYNHFKKKFEMDLKELENELKTPNNSTSTLNLYSNIFIRNFYYKPMMCKKQYST